MRIKIKEQSGFLLVEVLVAIAIIAVALAAILGLYIQNANTTSNSGHYTVAANLAQKQMELLKSKQSSFWATLTLPASIPWQDTGINPSELLPSYSVTTTAKACPEDTTNSLVQVEVMITWPEANGKRSITITNFFRKK